GFVPTGKVDNRNLIDRWVLSKYNSTVRETTKAMERYEPTRAARAVQSFVIDELSNWYLRRCRRRFWKNEMSDDKLAAYETFYRVLKGVSMLAAPFVPFLGEAVYQRLHVGADGGGEKGSVHLERYPKVDEGLIDADLERDMKGVLQAVTLARSVRNRAGIKVRTPLAQMLVHNPYSDETGWLGNEELTSLVADEINVKKITLLESTDKFISYSVKPDYSALGGRLGKRMKSAARVLENLKADRLNRFLAAAEITIEVEGKKELIKLEEVQILQQTAEGFAAEAEGRLTVILDVRLSPELIREGMARDLVNRIQNFRKESGLEVSDRIELLFRAPAELAGVFKEFGDHICSETLAERLEEGGKDWQFKTAFRLNEYDVELCMRRT
ncbi:MAG: class I tRNA ligase family protein, partial [Candidatus Krumholzibacteria bacterium]|nr:class I tRNA ligase family protein [Candidatus Krumholzibacteria bacterium]